MLTNQQGKSVHWLIAGEFNALDRLQRSSMAGIRLRAGAAVDFVRQHGWSCSVGEGVADIPEILVIGKIGAADLEERQLHLIRQIAEAKSKGSKIVLDYTDHHLGFASPMASFYKEVVKFVDVAVCPSDRMRSLLEACWNGRIEVIPDAIEVKAVAPKSFLNKPITMLWFGHATNIPFLARFIQSGIPGAGKYKLIALTNEQGIQWWKSQPIQAPENLGGELSIWSVPAMIEASGRSDICVIPSDVSDPRKSGASANRLITALALGLPVAAANLSSYLEFREYFVDINSEQFADLVYDPLAFSDQVARAQREIVPKFEINVIAEEWLSLFDTLHAGR